MSTIYLDNAATSYPKPNIVKDEINIYLNNFAVNPKRGLNPLINLANNALEESRKAIAQLFGANQNQLVFVPSTTYGLNILIRGFSFKKGDTIYI